MFKNNKGITIVSLVVMIIVMLILVVVGLTTGMNLLRDTELKTSITTMILIHSKAESIKESNDFDGSNDSTSEHFKLVGTLTTLTSAEKTKYGIAESDTRKWYKWGQDELNDYGIQTNMVTEKNGQYFLISYGDAMIDVLYSGGVKVVDIDIDGDGKVNGDGDKLWLLRDLMNAQGL